MPRKSLRNKQKEIAMQNQIRQEKAKERQKKRKEKEFIASQRARGLHMRTMAFKAAGSKEVTDVVLVYKLKDGQTDPFDRGQVLYVQDPTTEKIVHQEKVSGDPRSVVERFHSQMKMEDI